MRPEKQSIVAEYRNRLERAKFGLLADYTGLNVAQTMELRNRLKRAGANMQVVKNRLLRIAAGEVGLPKEIEVWLEGPNALIYGEGDVVTATKILKQFVEENERPVVRGGFLGERALTVEDIEELAKLPPREEMIARVVGLIGAPLAGLVGCLNQMVARLLYVLRQIEEEKRKASK